MGNTKILVSVTGPAEGKQSGQRGGADKLAKVEVEINFAGFSGVERRKRKSDKRTSEMEHCLREAFGGVLLLHLYPHSTITLNVHIISQDGSLLAACINASTGAYRRWKTNDGLSCGLYGGKFGKCERGRQCECG